MRYPSGSNLDPAWHEHLEAEYLFHYTSFEGLKGILSSRQIWATDLRYLNDTSEFEYSRNLAADKLQEIADRRCGTTHEAIALAAIRALGVFKRHFFATSFAVGGDLLSLWRGYCRRGDGIAIAFSRHKLEQLSERMGWQLWPVIYSPQAQRACLDVIEYDAAKAAGLSTTPTNFAKQYMDRFAKIGPFIKNPRYFEEGEWRIVPKTAKQTVRLRNQGRSRIPYVSMRLPLSRRASPVECILIGPDPAPSCDASAVSQWCRSNGFVFRIRASDVPYRAERESRRGSR